MCYMHNWITFLHSFTFYTLIYLICKLNKLCISLLLYSIYFHKLNKCVKCKTVKEVIQSCMHATNKNDFTAIINTATGPFFIQFTDISRVVI